jgi:RHS repeat-associated protein
MPVNELPPKLNITDSEYSYQTIAGNYSFPSQNPFLMQYTTTDGNRLTNASTFVVLSPGISLFNNATVVASTDYQYSIRYDYSLGVIIRGNVTITFDFRDDGPPKITAERAQSVGLPLPLVWATFTTDTVASNGTSLVDFGNGHQPVQISAPALRLWIGPNDDQSNWTRSLAVDWNDSGRGTAVVGPATIGTLDGPAILVAFPADMATVDPVLVGTSTVSSATINSVQRKTFEYGGRYWVFWYDGTSIVYASSQFSYANSQNTLVWTAKMSSGSGAISTSSGFDVDQRAGIVLIGYVPYPFSLSLNALVGTITGSFITWNGPYTVESFTFSGNGPPTVAIGSDGFFWTAVSYQYTGAGGTEVDIYRSTDPGATTFAWSATDYPFGIPSDSAVRLVGLSNGGMVYLESTRGYSTMSSRRYSASDWSAAKSWDLKLPTADARGSLFTAIAKKDDSVYIVFKGDSTNAPGIRYVILQTDDTLSPAPPSTPYPIDSSMPSSQPTVARDMNGDLHVFWLYTDAPGGTTFYHIRYSRQTPFTSSWTTPTDPFSSVYVPRTGLSAGLLASSQAFLIWTEGQSSPYAVNFGSVPTPMDVGSQTGQPWNKQGLSPFESYFSQLGEFVSPGSGLLTVRQTDLFLPGRNLNLEIARVFTTARGFADATASPYLYEDYPWANVGKGWSLDFPWLSDQYLHLPGGQMYVIAWNGDTFENHDGEHFVLSRYCPHACQYSLTMKSGIVYSFNAQTALTQISDTTFQNGITFSYGSYGISTITDTIGRQVTFSYNTNGTLQSVTSGPLKVAYTYQAVGGLTLLRTVSDALGRRTVFEHTNSGSAWLLTGITYPTLSKSSYTWSNQVEIGSDLHAFYVTRQDTLNSQGASLRSNRYDYTVVYGKVSYVTVTTYDAGTVKGSTVQMFDAVGGSSTTIRRDTANVQLDKQVTWFGGGAIGQADVYPGASASPAYSTSVAYDDWGNVIYSRDAVGHEKFASYVNTRYQGGFYAPGRITRSVSGLLFADDFEDRDLSDWTLDSTAGAPTLDYTTFESMPPSVKIPRTGATGVSSITHTFAAQAGDFVAEATVQAVETNQFHFVLLESSSGSPRVYAFLRENGQISWYDGTTYHDVMPYSAGQWYHLGFVVHTGSNKYDIWVNGQPRASNAAMPTGSSGSIDRIVIQSSCTGPNCGSATTFVDSVKAYRANALTVTGLTVGQVVAYASLEGNGFASMQVTAGNALVLTLNPGSFSHGTLAIYDRTGTVEFSSPTHEFWGGDSWAYTGPWKSISLARTTSGFLRYQQVIVDDSPAPGTPVNAEDGWNWGTYFNAPSGSSWQDHISRYLTGAHQHYYQDDPAGFTILSGQYHIQYVYIPPGQSAAEIMLQFQDSTTNSDRWAHRAYWGANLIGWGTDGTNSRRPMGALPTAAGRWLMLIVKADDVGTPTVSPIKGLAYTLYGGQAAWDFSAKGDAETGRIWVGGLMQGWTIELHDPSGALVASNVVPNGNTAQYLDLYGSARKVNVFPFDGYFVLKDSGGLPVYRSPALSLWGGDYYTYSATSFYPNAGVDPTIHDRPAGTLDYQTGRAAQPPVSQETYLRYTSQGLPDRSKVRDGSFWRETNYTYDGTYGLVTSVLDPKANMVSYSYSATYSKAYVTQISDAVGIRSRYAYDPTTGWPVSERDGRGYLSRYVYDLLGRSTEESRYDLPPSSEVLYLDMDWTTEEATPRLEDLSGRGNHGTISGPVAVPGKVGVARAFDGVDDVVTVPAASSLNTASFTAALWFNRDTFTTNQGLVGKASFANSWRIWTRTDGKIEADAKNDAIGNLVSQTTVVAGKWYHVALTFDGTTGRLYVNGVQEASAATGDWGGAYNVALWLGDTDSTSPFDGMIDEVRVFNAALNATNIGALFTNAYGRLSSGSFAYDDVGNVVTQYEPTTKPRMLHYDMETLLNGQMEDLSGHGGSGTLFGTATTAGKIGQARSFAGNGDRIQGPNIDVGTTFSVGLWVNATSGQVDGEGVLVKKDNTFSITLTAARIVNAYIYNGASWQLVSSNATLPVGSWTHVAVTYAASGGNTATYVYLNGAKDNAKTLTGLAAASSNPAMFGALTSTFQRLKGVEDEVQLFDRALSAAEVSQLFLGTEKGFYGKQYFDSLGRTTRSVRRDLFQTLVSWETSAYTFRDQMATRTVARNSTANFTTAYAYDFFGRPTSVTYPAAPPVTISYDDVNRIRTVVAENGRKVQYLYDFGGRTTAVREYYDATNYYTTAYAYDQVGNLLSVTNALNQATNHTYDNLNRLKKTIYPDATKYETYNYDEVGNLKNKTDRAAQVTTYGYDARYRFTSIDYTGTANDVSYVYDLSDNPTSITNPSSTIGYVYDGLDRATNETDTIAGATYGVGYSYDPAGRLTRLVYPDNTAVSYLYDSVGRTSQVKDASATYGSFAYSADDLTNNVTFGNGIVHSYAYNGRGWPTSIKATYGQTTYLSLGYAYDNSGNVLTMGSATFTYDKLDRLITASGGFGSQSYSYDAIGNRLQLDRNTTTAVLRPNSAGSSSQWTPVGCTQNWQCVDETTSDGDTTRVESSTLGAVDGYALQDLTQTSGTILSVSVTAVARFYALHCNIDPTLCYGSIKLQVNGYSGTTRSLISSYQSIGETWTTNPATGQPWTISQVNALQAGVQLVDVGNVARVTQVYVSVVIVDRTTYTYANGATGMDTLTSLSANGGAATSFFYDANGNLLSKFGSSKTCYAWNPGNLLTQVKSVSSACTDTGSQIQAYTYDGLGRRAKVDGTSSSTWTVSIYSGMDVIYEKDQSGAITRYVYANGMRIAKITSSGAVHYFLTDHLGSTRKIISGDTSRTELYSVDYEPFGKPYSMSGTQPDPHKFTAEKRDDPTGLEYLRARQYDPDVGRFLSADPVLGSPLRPQTLNRYAYVADNPLRYIDPTGRFLDDIDWASVGALLAGAAVVAGAIALCATGVGCIGVIAALIIAGAAGAGTAVAITAAEGRPIGLDTAVNGAVLGLMGGALVYGAAGAGFFGPAAAAATSTMDAISAGTLAAIAGALRGREDPTADQPLFKDPAIDDPALGSKIQNPRTAQTASQVDYVVGYVDDYGVAPPGYEGGKIYKNVGPGYLPTQSPGYYREFDIYPYVAGGRGEERLVMGLPNGEVYYTGDHYASFERLR